jgi:hypothetical protein
MSWTNYLEKGALDWLLEPTNPSVRFWALQHLEDKKPTDKVVYQTQNEIMKSECIKAILDVQNPEGHWGNKDDMYNPKYQSSTHNLLILAELGAKRNPPIERGIENIFRFQRLSGHFLTDFPKTDKGRASIVNDGCCLDGNILYYMIHFGYLDDPRVKKLIQFQIDYHSDNVGGWGCRAYGIDRSKLGPVNCYMGGIKVLKALSSIPKRKRSKKINDIIDQEVEIILENHIYQYHRNPDGSRKAKAGWKRFGFPLYYQSDALEVLDILTNLGVHDERMQDAIDLVLSVKQEDGKSLLKHTFNEKQLCKIDEKHKPSKWITLRALRVLKRFYS